MKFDASIKWNEINPRTPAGISHAIGVFHVRSTFHKSARIYFVEKETWHNVSGLFFWSGRRGSNSLPPPWQGGALPDELRPHFGFRVTCFATWFIITERTRFVKPIFEFFPTFFVNACNPWKNCYTLCNDFRQHCANTELLSVIFRRSYVYVL